MRTGLIVRLLLNPINKCYLCSVIYKAKIRKILRIVNPFYYAPLIAFIGTDGSGKSTMTKKINSIFSKNGFESKYVYMGWNEPILPVDFFSKLLHRFLGTGKKGNGKEESKKSLYRQALYFSADLFVLFEMYLRYVLKILPSRKLGRIVFSDRYAYDRILYRHSSGFARWFLLNLFPKPSYTFQYCSPTIYSTPHLFCKGNDL